MEETKVDPEGKTAYSSLPAEIRAQIDALAEGPETPQLPDMKEKLAANWQGKFDLFESQVRLLGMEDVQALGEGDGRGFLAMTYSGSILSVGPAQAEESSRGLPGSRWVEYVPIKLRLDVPEIASGYGAMIVGAATRGTSLRFDGGPVKSTSAVYRIAACSPDVVPDEQDRRIREAAIFLTHGFIKMNRTLSEERAVGVEQFTLRGMAQYVARKNDLKTVLVKRVLEDFFSTAETGLLLGERVSLGRLGSASLKVKSARKARVIKNPITKEEVLVPAKPETPVPKFSFHKSLKDKAAATDVGQIAGGDGSDAEDDEE
jgi:nucleoid DNA-binding protein